MSECGDCNGAGLYVEYDAVVGRKLSWPCVTCSQTGEVDDDEYDHDSEAPFDDD